MSQSEFRAELRGLYARASNAVREAKPGSREWKEWNTVFCGLSIALEAHERLATGPAVEMPHLKALTIPLAELKSLEGLTKGVK